MTLGEHLEELRSRSIRAFASIGISAVICYIFINTIMGFLTTPVFAVYRRHNLDPQMVSLAPAEAFLTDLKVAILTGMILASPYAISQLWGFVAAGLYPNERRWVRRFAPASIALFFTGVTFLLLIVSPLLLDFLLTYRNSLPNIDLTSRFILPARELTQPGPDIDLWERTAPFPILARDPVEPPEAQPWVSLRDREIRIRLGDEHFTVAHLRRVTGGNILQPVMRISEYIIFIIHLSIAFGIGFQVPVVVTFLAAAGIAEARDMAKFRRHILFGMACGASFITPPDVTSLVMLLGPMAGLFEIGLAIARIIERKRAKAERAE